MPRNGPVLCDARPPCVQGRCRDAGSTGSASAGPFLCVGCTPNAGVFGTNRNCKFTTLGSCVMVSTQQCQNSADWADEGPGTASFAIFAFFSSPYVAVPYTVRAWGPAAVSSERGIFRCRMGASGGAQEEQSEPCLAQQGCRSLDHVGGPTEDEARYPIVSTKRSGGRHPDFRGRKDAKAAQIGQGAGRSNCGVFAPFRSSWWNYRCCTPELPCNPGGGAGPQPHLHTGPHGRHASGHGVQIHGSTRRRKRDSHDRRFSRSEVG
jgi:hypothetical protein